MEQKKRRDKNRAVLKVGESIRSDGRYSYRWTDRQGKRHNVYAATLSELRKKEDAIDKDRHDNIRPDAQSKTVNDVYDMWCELKRGLKDNTFQNYKYMYSMFVWPTFGKLRLGGLKRSDVKRFYNKLADEDNLQIATIDNIHTVLHQVLDMAVDDDYLRSNPTDGALKELKQSHVFKVEKRRALTLAEQELFLDFLRKNPRYQHWYPVFAVLVGTGLRVGEVTGLRWCDIDLEEGMIDVNHTLVYYNHAVDGCYFNIHTPKTEAGRRTVPMTEAVKEAFVLERQYQEEAGITCRAHIDGYTDFIFLNQLGSVQHQSTLNKAIRRIENYPRLQ